MSELLTLESPDGTDQFTLKVHKEITTEVSLNLVLDTVSNSVNQLVGTRINVNTRKRTINCKITNMSASDYPDTYHDPANVTNDNHAYAYELERAIDEWGIDLTNGLDGGATLYWSRGGISQQINGIVSTATISLYPDQSKEHYEVVMEFTEVDLTYQNT